MIATEYEQLQALLTSYYDNVEARIAELEETGDYDSGEDDDLLTSISDVRASLANK